MRYHQAEKEELEMIWNGEKKMSDVNMKEIETEQELRDVLELCYNILGTENNGLYGYDAWHKRFIEGTQPLVFAIKDEIKELMHFFEDLANYNPCIGEQVLLNMAGIPKAFILVCRDFRK